MIITYDKTYNGLQINTDLNKGQGCITSILDSYQIHLIYMINAHSKVMQVRFDLHYPTDGSIVPTRKHIHDFNYNLKRKLQRKKVVGGHKVDPQLLWTGETNTSYFPHYHFILLVNGNAINNYWDLLDSIVRPLWEKAIGVSNNTGLVDYCDKAGPNGLMIIRPSSPEFLIQLNRCSYQASYLAKVKTKETRGKGNWLTGGSRVPSVLTPLPASHLNLFE